MPSLSNPEGVIFGAGEHLPDATALGHTVLNWNDYLLDAQVSGNIAAISDYPEYIVRYENHGRREQVMQLFQAGYRHLQLLSKNGIVVAPQRFVEGPMMLTDAKGPDGYCSVYSITDRLYGRQLTTNPLDAHYSLDVISAQARYLQEVRDNNEPMFMWDTVDPHQYTVTEDGAVVLHDTGFNGLRPTKDSHDSSPIGLSFSYAIGSLNRWAIAAKIDPPQELHELQQDAISAVKERFNGSAS